MCHAIEFIETSLFTRQIKQLASDEELRALQRLLIGNPDFGDLIQDTGGLRKIRMATGSQGKSGGVRVIYYNVTIKGRIYLALIYPKSEQDELSQEQKKMLRQVAELLN